MLFFDLTKTKGNQNTTSWFYTDAKFLCQYLPYWRHCLNPPPMRDDI